VLRIVKLERTHDCSGFDCGAPPLNEFLKRYALQNQQSGSAQTYLAYSDETLLGYYSLAVGEVAHQNAPDRMKKGLARHPVPVLVLARLAVDLRMHGKGIGAGLLKDAARNTLVASQIAGIRALLVHAKDDAARRFYLHFGFADGFEDPHILYFLTKDLRAIAET
jgi:GNAT superfamily N-acetyltransferase